MQGIDPLATGVLDRDARAIARLISRLENGAEGVDGTLARLFPHTGHAYTVGVTGPPGAGKSTLVDGLIRQARASGMSVAVLAVDPSSPFSGGALLGDRIRIGYDPQVYIRSMSTRDQLGGLAAATRNAVHVLDAAGYDLILVETVGVGQSELAIAGLADTLLLVLMPGTGDAVQLMKAGVLEVADIYVLNKADLQDAAQAARALREMLHDGRRDDWSPPIVEATAHQGRGLDALWQRIGEHRAYLEASGVLEHRRRARLRSEMVEAIEARLRTEVLGRIVASPCFDALQREVAARRSDPASAAREALTGFLAASDGTP